MTDSFKASTPLGDKTLAQLWDCTRRRGDMPGFAKAITAILGAMRGEDDQEFNMTRTVLSDPVLTQKVLRLANSCLLYTSPSPRDRQKSRMPSSA